MKFEHPSHGQVPQLLTLWKDVFGEYGGFWELFLTHGFLPENCLCAAENGEVTTALCWFDCTCSGQKLAYIYAVVTHPGHRNQGLCRRLLEFAHSHLAERGYWTALLVPAEESLRQMYRKLGYRDCTTVSQISCLAGAEPAVVRTVCPEEYAALRRAYLPECGVLQEGENLAFLAAQAQLYAGKDLLLAAYAEEETLHGMELLGNADAAPGILRSLGFSQGVFRIPGADQPFAMFHPLREDAAVPDYFGFAFD